MRVLIEFNGMQRHLTNASSIAMPIGNNTRVTDALEYLMQQYPGLKIDKNTVVATVNQKTASLDSVLNANDVISFLPPIGGG
jgi:molybdopterin converting factor small subunit